MQRRIVCYEEDKWVKGACEQIVGRLRSAIAGRRKATVLLAGGNTPKPIYQALAGAERIDWSCVHFFWGDERNVPPEDPKSNFGMAMKTLLEPLGIAPNDPRIHRFPTGGTPTEDAAMYEQNLRHFFDTAADQVPRFDIILLGVGEDGHTASLFPGTEALEVQDRLAAANTVPQLQSTRLTVTYPLLNAGRAIYVLVRGADKAEIVREVLQKGPGRYPIEQVKPQDGEVVWLLDHAAASKLPEGFC